MRTDSGVGRASEIGSCSAPERSYPSIHIDRSSSCSEPPSHRFTALVHVAYALAMPRKEQQSITTPVPIELLGSTSERMVLLPRPTVWPLHPTLQWRHDDLWPGCIPYITSTPASFLRAKSSAQILTLAVPVIRLRGRTSIRALCSDRVGMYWPQGSTGSRAERGACGNYAPRVPRPSVTMDAARACAVWCPTRKGGTWIGTDVHLAFRRGSAI